MIVQYASDLHLEFPQNEAYIKLNPLQSIGDVLLLAGDIVPFAVIEKYADFFSYLSDNFKTTYWVPGNHEYYYFDISKKSGTLNEKIKDNVFLINNTSVIHNNIRFIFSTLWSRISLNNQWYIERGMNDFHVIKYKGKNFSTELFNQLHEESILFIEQELHHNNTDKTLVVTHHVPTLLNYPEKYKRDILNEAFAIELMDFIETRKPDYWIYGHTHANNEDFRIGDTLLLTNQLGYVGYNEHKSFLTYKAFEL